MELKILLNATNSNEILTNKSLYEQIYKEYIFVSINCFIYLSCSTFSIILNLPLIINWILVCKKENYADYIFFSMACADFIEGFLVCPIYFIEKLIEINLISSYKISETINCLTESIDYSIWLISLSSLFLLSLHRFKQLISPFKEGVELNRFRFTLIISIWFIFPMISCPLIWYRKFITYEDYFELLFYISDCIFILTICILNILIMIQFRSKVKNKKLKKNNFKKEKKAILCTLSLTLLLLITMGPFIIVHPFTIYKYYFADFLYGIYYSFSYFYIIVDPIILLFFNPKLRIKFQLICKAK